MSNTLQIAAGQRVIHDKIVYVIARLIDFKNVIALKCGTKQHCVLPISELQPIDAIKHNNESTQINAMPDATKEEWDKALDKKRIIDPLLAIPRRPRSMVKKAAESAGVSTATVYNWIKRFQDSGLLSSLLNIERNGGRKIGRLDGKIETLIDNALKEFHLKRRKSIRKTYEELKKQCGNAGFDAPHVNTLYRRAAWLTDYDKIAATRGKELAEQLCSPKPGTIIGADTLLSLVQIDHMNLDLQIVDDRDRLPIGRAWLTLAICVFSRMVVGLYISLDPPSAHSAGMCIVNSILRKDKWLYTLGIDIEWPCWGKMATIHMDNAREFRGNTIRRACQEYGIDPVFRPVKKPRYGAYIERYLGTVAEELKSLPGATFSTPDERGCYDSEGHAALTVSELETYLVNFIVGDYHQRIHSELTMPPIAKWSEGVFGTNQIPGRGLPQLILNEDRLRLDFMPYFERTIQSDGVQWEHVLYYDDVLRRWYNVKCPENPRKNMIFRFHYDPRNIGTLYFYDPNAKQYFRIPYRDPSRAPMSKWERDAIINKLHTEGIKQVNEELIFITRKKLHALISNSVKETKLQRRDRQRRINHGNAAKPKTVAPPKSRGDSPAPSIFTNIQPFEDLDA